MSYFFNNELHLNALNRHAARIHALPVRVRAFFASSLSQYRLSLLWYPYKPLGGLLWQLWQLWLLRGLSVLTATAVDRLRNRPRRKRLVDFTHVPATADECIARDVLIVRCTHLACDPGVKTVHTHCPPDLDALCTFVHMDEAGLDLSQPGRRHLAHKEGVFDSPVAVAVDSRFCFTWLASQCNLDLLVN